MRWGLLIFCAVWLLLPAVANAEKCNATVGSPAPALQGSDLSGRAISLDSMRGKWVYIDFWASWCKPCMRELPRVVALHDSLANRSDFAVVSIALDDQSTRDDLHEVTDRYKISYPVVCDNAGWSSPHVQEWCVNSIPATYLIDPQGRIVERNIAPEDVPGMIGRAAPQRPAQLAPEKLNASSFQFTAKHRLLRDSPTSGKKGNRDLQISLPQPANATVRYQVVVQVDAPSSARDRTLMVRYDLEFKPGKPGADFPFEVAIREASGARVGALSGKPVTVSSSATDVLPGAQIAYDDTDQRLLFILPLPAKLVAASYTVSLYDADAHRFGSTLAADIATI